MLQQKNVPDLSSDPIKTLDRKLLQEELGVKRETLQSLFKDTEARIDDIDKKEYRKMWQNDGQIAAIVKLPQILLMGAGFDIVQDGEDMEDELQFVKDNLLGGKARGGMQISLEEVIEDMTYAPFEGARFYELVYFIDKGQVKIKKIAPRDNITCTPVKDEWGCFVGFWQVVSTGTKIVQVFIPLEKAVAIIVNEAYGGLNGLSMLKAAWYHWDKKHKLYFIAHLASELQTIPPVVVQHDNVGDSIVGAVNAAVDERGMNSRITVPKNVTISQLGSASVSTVDIKELINHHNSQIAKSLQAQWIDLGSETSQTGSRATSVSQVGVYMQFVEGLGSRIENIFNNDIIPRLIDYNFASGRYPKLKFNPLEDANKQILLDMLEEINRRDKLPTEIKKSIIIKTSTDLGLTFDESKLEAEMDKTTSEPVEPPTGINDPNNLLSQNLVPEMDGNDQVKMSESDPNESMRPLYLDEQKVDFTKIDKTLSNVTDDLTRELAQYITSNQDQVISDIGSIMRTGDVKRLLNLQVADYSGFINTLEKYQRIIYEFGKLQASKEIGIPVVTTLADQKILITLGASVNGQKALDDLRTNIINITKQNMINGVSSRETEIAVGSQIKNYISDKIGLVADQNIISTFDQSLNDVFSTNSDSITGYRYSAVLDSQTTDFCRSLDGKVFPKDSSQLANITPPNHFRCRSRLVPIMKGESVDFENRNPKSFSSLYGFRDTSAFPKNKTLPGYLDISAPISIPKKEKTLAEMVAKKRETARVGSNIDSNYLYETITKDPSLTEEQKKVQALALLDKIKSGTVKDSASDMVRNLIRTIYGTVSLKEQELAESFLQAKIITAKKENEKKLAELTEDLNILISDLQ